MIAPEKRGRYVFVAAIDKVTSKANLIVSITTDLKSLSLLVMPNLIDPTFHNFFILIFTIHMTEILVLIGRIIASIHLLLESRKMYVNF